MFPINAIKVIFCVILFNFRKEATTCVVFSHSLQAFITGSEDGSIKVFDLGACSQTLQVEKIHAAPEILPIGLMAISNCGFYIVTASGELNMKHDNILKVTDLQRSKVVREIRTNFFSK